MAGKSHIQETVSNDCSSDIRAGALPFNFAGTTTLNGDEGFLDGVRENTYQQIGCLNGDLPVILDVLSIVRVLVCE